MRGPCAGASANSGPVSDQRPCTCGARRPAAPGEAAAGVALLAGASGQPRRAQRREGVVGHLAGPDQVPERLLQLDRLGLGEVGEQVGPEGGAAAEPLAQRVVQRLGRRLALERRRPEPAGVLAEVERHPAGARARARRRRPRPARRSRRAGRARPASRRRRGAAARRAPTPPAPAPGPAAAPAARAAGRRRPPPAVRSTPCQAGRKRASARCSGRRSTSCAQRRAARRGAGGAAPRGRTTRARCPPGRSSPCTRSPARSSSRSTGAEVHAVAAATARAVVNGPCVRA